MMNMTVATTEAAIVTSPVKKARIRKGNARNRTKVRRRWGGLPEGITWPLETQDLMDCGGREETAKGLRKIIRKFKTAAAMKRPNIQCDATFARCRGSWMSLGKATVRRAVSFN
jgi:hypothetical protein